MNSKISYKDAGVDIEKGDALVESIKSKVSRTYGERVKSGVGGFACLYESGDRLLAAGTDGVGTKLMIAQELNIHHTIGIDLVAMCVNDILCTGAKPLFFMDYLACGKLDVETSSQILDGIVEGCLQSESALIGGETAEMPGMYPDGKYDLAGFSVGEVFPDRLIDGSKIQEGHSLIALPSSGVHSNGFSLLRKLIEMKEVDLMKKALTPTKIYWNSVKGLLGDNLLSGLAHITGGGLSNISRLNQNFNYQITSMEVFDKAPEIFKILKERSGLDNFELFRTFNMGMGMVLISSSPQKVLAHLKEIGEEAYLLGEVKSGEGKVLLPDGTVF